MDNHAATTMPWPAALAATFQRGVRAVMGIAPEAGDALLYLAAALFALLTIYTSTNALYQVWGRMALSPYVFGALASAALALLMRRARRRRSDGRLSTVQHRRARLARIVVAVCVFAGALAVPLG
jgi:hypothetical protein